jgi:hypothetical protein
VADDKTEDQTHHSAVAQRMLVPVVPDRAPHTEEDVPTVRESDAPETPYQRAVAATLASS